MPVSAAPLPASSVSSNLERPYRCLTGTAQRSPEFAKRRSMPWNSHTPKADAIRSAAMPLGTARDLDPLLDRVGDARYVLLGEASHGTSEYYTWRAEITKRLIIEKGFSFIGVEGDWPDCYRVNRYVKRYPASGESAEAVLHEYERWPTWMWANREIVELADWLHDHNLRQADDAKAGF